MRSNHLRPGLRVPSFTALISLTECAGANSGFKLTFAFLGCFFGFLSLIERNLCISDSAGVAPPDFSVPRLRPVCLHIFAMRVVFHPGRKKFAVPRYRQQ